jgi:hypothetical protein
MSIVSRPNTPEFEKNYEAAIGRVEVRAECPSCKRMIKLYMSKADFDAHKTVHVVCQFCGSEHDI